MHKKKIEKPLISLRYPKLSDVESITKYCKNPAIGRYMPNLPYPYTQKDALWFIKKTVSDRKKGTQLVHAITLKETNALGHTNQLVGMISYHLINKQSKRAEMGYWVAKPFWGQGIVSEAVMQMLDIGFKKMRFHRVCARVFHPNVASHRVLLKCGFVYEGTLRQTEFHRRKWLDEYFYGILADEYKKLVK